MAELTCTLREWLRDGRGEALLAVWPVESVRTDRVPRLGRCNVPIYWLHGHEDWHDDQSAVPVWVLDAMRGHVLHTYQPLAKAYRTPLDAHLALSEALIRLARPRDRAP